jgi:hypothetical protein
VKAASWLLCASVLSAQSVTVTGSVTNAITHEPIEGVSVVLIAIVSGSSGANTDPSGRFRIRNVKPGGYRLAPSRVGFDGAAVEIRIEGGADPPPLDVRMMPWPGVRGRVIDPERQPVPGVRVRAINLSNALGVVYEFTTDAAGRFALERLPPGRYRFLATPPAAGNATGPMEIAPTWFPDVLAEHDAQSVSLAPGDDFSGYEIVLRAAPVFRVSGRVIDERAGPAAGATVETSLADRKTTTREDGTFDLARVRSGEGMMRVEWRRGDVPLRGFAKVAVDHHDVEGLTIRAAAPVGLSGEIELDGQAGHLCEGEAILAPVDGEGERARAEFSESGIRFERVYPGRYRLIVLPGWISGRHYLDSVRMGERDLTLDEFEVVSGMMPFRVELRTGGGNMSGTVENGNGGLAVLTPQDERLRFRPFVVVAPIQGGTFALDNLRPGDYYAFALQGSFNSDEMRNPEYAQPYLDSATSVRVERGSTGAVTLHYVKEGH